MDAIEAPVGVRTQLAHAVVEIIAADAGIRALHVKGPALHPTLSAGRGQSMDADILCEPGRAEQLRRLMLDAGWRTMTTFSTGSAFEHAATLHHDDWGQVDLHRMFPGIAPKAFDDLWAHHERVSLAHVDCAVPDLRAQRVLLLAHAARGGRAGDLEAAWLSLDDAEQTAVCARASQLGADVALAAALGELDPHDRRPEAALWRAFASRNRVDEWIGRFRTTTGVRARAALVLRLVRLNRDHLRMELGREPGRRDLVRAWVRRIGRAGRALRDRVAATEGRP